MKKHLNKKKILLAAMLIQNKDDDIHGNEFNISNGQGNHH